MKNCARFRLTLIVILIGAATGQKMVAQLSYPIPDEYILYAEFCPEDASMYGYPVSPQHFMRGVATIRFDEIPTGQVTFFLHGECNIDSVMSQGKNLGYQTEKVFYPFEYSLITVKTILDKPLNNKEFSVHYSGFFHPSRVSALSNFMRIDQDEGVFLRAYGYSIWFPIFMEASMDFYTSHFSRVTINAPENWKTLVSGKMIREESVNSRTLTVWEPGEKSIFDIQCISSDYQVIRQDNVLIYHFNEPESAASSNQVLQFVLELDQLFKKNLRPVTYKDPVYIVEMPKYGDISGDNIIGIQKSRFQDFSNIWTKLTIAHELVHPYVQIPLKPDNPLYAFVWEGFPSFFMYYAAAKVLDDDEFDLYAMLKGQQSSYLKKKETGVDRRGNPLPREKPILQITADEIGSYKDTFVLSDRVWLFFYYLWREMGEVTFDRFLKDLFSHDDLTYDSLVSLVARHLPGSEKDVDIWLNTNEFPERYRIQ